MYFVWALVITGIFLIFLEIFLPSYIMLIGGGLLLIASIFFFHMVDPRPFSLFVYSVSLVIGSFLAIRMALWKMRATKKTESPDPFEALIYRKELVGKVGIAETDLGPFGHILIDDKKFDARSEKGTIFKGSFVQVLSGHGTHLLVQIMNREGPGIQEGMQNSREP